jgi:hypothetical protein
VCHDRFSSFFARVVFFGACFAAGFEGSSSPFGAAFAFARGFFVEASAGASSAGDFFLAVLVVFDASEAFASFSASAASAAAWRAAASSSR